MIAYFIQLGKYIIFVQIQITARVSFNVRNTLIIDSVSILCDVYQVYRVLSCKDGKSRKSQVRHFIGILLVLGF